jgi:hypothetical protein
MDENDLQRLKQDDPTISTEQGISIDLRCDNENALDSIRLFAEKVFNGTWPSAISETVTKIRRNAFPIGSLTIAPLLNLYSALSMEFKELAFCYSGSNSSH